MRRAPGLLAAAAAATLVVGPLAAMAGAATTPASGVGTGSVSSTVLSVQLGNGDLLTVRVLGDDGVATIDPAKGTPISTETFRPLSISSKTVPALNVSVPSVATTSSGTEDKKSVEPQLPSSPAFTGKLNAALSSVIDAAGARSGLQAGLADLNVVGGLVNVAQGTVNVASAATKTAATGSRSVTIPDVNVLNLGALLNGLGIKLTNLSVNQLLGLVNSLGVTVQGVASPVADVSALTNAITSLTGQTGALTASLCNTVDGVLKNAPDLSGVTGLLGTAGTTIGGLTGNVPVAPSNPLPSVTSPVTGGGSGGTGGVGVTLPGIGRVLELPGGFSCSNLQNVTVQQLLDKVDGLLGNLLSNLLAQLSSTPLLEVKDVTVGLVATAADTVANSKADVVAKIGSVNVGKLPVPGISGLDLTAPVAQINAATAAIQDKVGGVLGTINAQLANLVKVDVLKIDKLVDTAGGYTHAGSSITALKATITPPALPLSVQAVDLTSTVGSVITSVGGTVPVLSPVMDQLKASLGGLSALTAPTSVTVGTLSADSTFKPVVAATPGASTPGGELPRTGGNAAFPAMLAVAVAGSALAIRRLLRSATTS